MRLEPRQVKPLRLVANAGTTSTGASRRSCLGRRHAAARRGQRQRRRDLADESSASPGDPFTQVLYGVAFGDATHGWAVGKTEVIVATSDGGSSWHVQHEGPNDGCLLDVAASDARHAWAAGYTDGRHNGLILATSDGGATWRRQYGGSNDLAAVAVIDAQHGWAVGSKGILATSDGGAHCGCMRGLLPLSPAGGGLHRLPPRLGGGRHRQRRDGTRVHPGDQRRRGHWAAQLSGTRDRLNGVSFVDSLHGWAVGDGGVLYRTTAAAGPGRSTR